MNLRGTGQNWLWRLNNSELQDCIFDLTHDVLVARMKKVASSSAVGPGVPVILSLAINGMKLAKVLEVSASHKAIIGGAFPNHVFDISNLPKDNVNNVIAGTSESVNINNAMEVKLAVMSFRSTASVVPPSVIVAAHPQGTNETSNLCRS